MSSEHPEILLSHYLNTLALNVAGVPLSGFSHHMGMRPHRAVASARPSVVGTIICTSVVGAML